MYYPSPMRHHWKKILAVAVGLLISVVVLAALFVDPAAKYFINRQLAQAPGVMGHVEAVHVSLLRLDATAEDFNLQVTRRNGSLPVVAVKSVSVDADVMQLLRGVIELSAVIDEPHVTLWRELIEETDPEEVKQEVKEKAPAPNFSESMAKLMPFKVNEFAIKNGVIRYRDPSVNPPVDLLLDQLNLDVHNLTNRTTLKEDTFADASLSARLLQRGTLNVHVKFDPVRDEPTLKMDAQMKNIPLPGLNDALRAYTKFEIEEGTAALFTEYAARDGAFRGYVKPAFTNVKVHPWKQGLEGQPFQRFWRAAVGGVVNLFKSEPEKQVAAKASVEGHFDNPHIGTAQAVLSLLKNGFIEALMQKLDYTVSIGGVSAD